MAAGTVTTTQVTRLPASCERIALAALLSNDQMDSFKGIRAEACGRVLRLYGVDPAARRLAERLARAILGAEVVRFEDAA